MLEFLTFLLIVGLGGFFLIALCMLCGHEYSKKYNNEECENMKLLNDL